MVKELLGAGWKLNEIMDSPLYYLVEVMSLGSRDLSEEQQEAVLNAL